MAHQWANFLNKIAHRWVNYYKNGLSLVSKWANFKKMVFLRAYNG